jgi:hypothetical protein
MCHQCQKTARIADNLFTIIISELLFDNITQWRRLVVGTLTIGCIYQYYRDEQLVEVM